MTSKDRITDICRRWTRMIRGRGAPIALLTIIICGAARAEVTISTSATRNMSCANDVCSPTAADAVLNVGDLETMLASGSAKVTTTGKGVQADNIDVAADVTWSSTNTLALDAYDSLTISDPLSVTGHGGLSLTNNDGGHNGTISFVSPGRIIFKNLSSQLSIHGTAYVLVDSVATLAKAIGQNPNGNFALADDFNASGDGAYSASPIQTPLIGSFNGLGNRISKLRIVAYAAQAANIGLFSELNGGGIDDLGLTNVGIKVYPTNTGNNEVNIGALVAMQNGGHINNDYSTGALTATRPGYNVFVAGLVGINMGGKIENSWSSARVTGVHGAAGGLIGDNQGLVVHCRALGAVTAGGTLIGGLAAASEAYQGFNGVIEFSYASGSVTSTGRNTQGGGLVGENEGTIVQSFATGATTALFAGGLVGVSAGGFQDTPGIIKNSYSTGAVTTTLRGRDVGGLIGEIQGGAVSDNYSTGAPTAPGGHAEVGGVVGEDDSELQVFEDTYWNTDTSGITNLSQGAGNIANDPGLQGLSTSQLQAGLPAGFDPRIWAEKSAFNGGLPYLIANPPTK